MHSVHCFYHNLFHYRLPVWDQLIQRGSDRYDVTIYGQTNDGKAIGGESRPYLRHMPVTANPRSLAYTFQGAKKLVQQEKPDVLLVLSNPRNRFCWQAPALARSYGGASIAWSKVHSYSRTPPWLLRPMKARFYQRYDLAFTYGPQSSSELASIGYPEECIYTAYNTVDTRFIFTDGERIRQRGEQVRVEAGLEGKRVLLCVSKMEPQKRHEDLLAAWPMLRELDPQLVLVLIGRGALTEQIREKARLLDAERIIFRGEVPDGDDYAWIATSDMTVQCGMVGLVLNQSMALGTPTIVADEPGADSEILQHELTGWRYEKGNANELVRTVSRVLAEHEQRESVIRRARSFMREEATVDNMVHQLDAAITRAITISNMRKR